MVDLVFQKFEVKPADITAIRVTDDNRFDVEDFLRSQGQQVKMTWNDDYTEWALKIMTNYGWRKITEGMWVLINPELGTMWYPVSHENMVQKYQEVVTPIERLKRTLDTSPEMAAPYDR